MLAWKARCYKRKGMVESNLSTMFTAVNQQTSEIAAQVGQTPQGWNSSIFSMIRNISDSVVIPIAGIIITLILCYELISMLTERNNLHDVDTWMFFKYFVKMWIAVYLVSHTFDIAMAVFDIGQSVVNSSSGIIRGNTAIDISSLSMQMQAAMATMAIGELVTLALESAARKPELLPASRRQRQPTPLRRKRKRRCRRSSCRTKLCGSVLVWASCW